jgi:hypothetical protein
MMIESSQVFYQAEHRSVSTTVELTETLVRPRATTTQPQKLAADTVQLSSAAASGRCAEADSRSDLTPGQQLALLALEAIIGHKINLHHLRASGAGGVSAGRWSSGKQAGSAPAQTVQRHTVVHSEAEQTHFQAQGVVQTTDGRGIRFSVNLSMQRQSSSVTSSTAAQSTDPLVVNFGGQPARLSSAKVAFDLNSDGTEEQVSFVASGSGFLALDKNGDGVINNGGELFGPQTGNGFSELAAYDSDGNGWIDEADPIFAKLQIWTPAGLATLAERGVGAIATGAVETPFALKDASNTLQGDIRATGVYLMENGSAGTVQQVDLAQG